MPEIRADQRRIGDGRGVTVSAAARRWTCALCGDNGVGGAVELDVHHRVWHRRCSPDEGGDAG